MAKSLAIFLLVSVLLPMGAVTSTADDFKFESMDDMDFDRVVSDDFNGDGKNDLLLFKEGGAYLHFFTNTGHDTRALGSAAFSYSHTLKLQSKKQDAEILAVAFGDVLGSSSPELVVLNEQPSPFDEIAVLPAAAFLERASGRVDMRGEAALLLEHNGNVMVLVDVKDDGINEGRVELIVDRYKWSNAERSGLKEYYKVGPSDDFIWDGRYTFAQEMGEQLKLQRFTAHAPLLPRRLIRRGQTSIPAVLVRNSRGWIESILYMDRERGEIVVSQDTDVDIDYLNKRMEGVQAHADMAQSRLRHAVIGDFLGEKRNDLAFVLGKSNKLHIASYPAPPKQVVSPAGRIDDLYVADLDGEDQDGHVQDELLVVADSKLYQVSLVYGEGFNPQLEIELRPVLIDFPEKQR